MTGLLLIFVAVIWFAIVFFLTKFITIKLPRNWWGITIRVLLLIALIPLPLIDEIVGKRQFEQLCKENATIHVNRTKAVGKTVYFDPQPSIEIKDAWVRIVMKPKRFVDASTGELVLSYNTLIAEGGRFIRALGISEGGMPLTFNGNCQPDENPKKLFQSLNITAQDRPKQ